MSPLVPYTEKGMNFSDLPEPDSPRNEPKQHLLYSVGTDIRLHHDGENREYLIRRRLQKVFALAVYKDKLIESGQSCKIFYTETEEPIAERRASVNALTVHDNHLFHAEIPWLQIKGLRIYHTETGKAIAERPGRVFALAVYKDNLIDAGEYGKIFYTETEELIAERPDWVRALAVHNNRLVDAGDYRKIFYTKTKEPIAERPSEVNALAIYNNRLVDAGDYGGIFYTEEKEPIVETHDTVYAILPINDEMANRLLKLPEVEEIK
jgi:hypothetical protein